MGYMQRMLVNLGLENPERIVLDTEILNYYSYSSMALSLTSYKKQYAKEVRKDRKRLAWENLNIYSNSSSFSDSHQPLL